jgi:hypothetical protein
MIQRSRLTTFQRHNPGPLNGSNLCFNLLSLEFIEVTSHAVITNDRNSKLFHLPTASEDGKAEVIISCWATISLRTAVIQTVPRVSGSRKLSESLRQLGDQY